MPSVLVVDDEPAILQFFRRAFQDNEELEVLTAESASEGLKIFRAERPDVGVFDVRLPDYDGLSLLREIQQFDLQMPVVFITGGGTSSTAIEAMRLGAFDYLTKPLDLREVRELVERAVQVRRLMNAPVGLPMDDDQRLTGPDLSTGDTLIGRSEAMQEVYKAIGRVAPRNVNVLIRGESGTGKELVARAIFQYSNRSDQSFLAVNCAAIPEALLESELFGHEKGSFTGADRRRIGKFEQCDGGTLFLDEIGDMPLMLQSKMLRVLQDQRFERVGGNSTIETDLRIIAATHRDLERMSEESKFRWDLYYRLNVYSIEIPPLRERLEDIPLLVSHFLQRAGLELNKRVTAIEPQALEFLKRYHWPGNVRELQSIIRQAVLATTGPVVLLDFLPELIRREGQLKLRHFVKPEGHAAEETQQADIDSNEVDSTIIESTNTDSSDAVDVSDVNSVVRDHESNYESASETATISDANSNRASGLATFSDLWDRFVDERLAAGEATIFEDATRMAERETITRVLRHTQGNQVKAAKLLGTTRTTLRAKMKSLNIVIEHVVETPNE